MTMSAAIAIAIALLVTGESDRGRVRALIAPIALSYALAMLLLTPYLYYLFAFGFPHGAIWSSDTGSIDLLNFVVPVPTNALGRLDAMRADLGQFPRRNLRHRRVPRPDAGGRDRDGVAAMA